MQVIRPTVTSPMASWSPDEKSIYLIELSHATKNRRTLPIRCNDRQDCWAAAGRNAPKYVEPQHPIVFLPWDGGKFIYQSSGVTDITYIYATSPPASKANGKAMPQAASTSNTSRQQLTEGKWLVGDILGFNARGKSVIFQGVDGTGSNNFAVNVNTKSAASVQLPFYHRRRT